MLPTSLKNVHKTNTLLIPRDCNQDFSRWQCSPWIPPSLGMLLRHHSINCFMDFSSKQWTPISCPLDNFGQKTLTSCTVQRPVVISSIASLCASVSIWGTPAAQTFGSFSTHQLETPKAGQLLWPICMWYPSSISLLLTKALYQLLRC